MKFTTFCQVAILFLCFALPAQSAFVQKDKSTQPQYSDLIQKSQNLTKQQQAAADNVFFGAMELWKNKEFEAAMMAFKDGLEIDPANVGGNYYYGDCLLRMKDEKGALEFLARAATLGKGTPEGYKAQAALKPLAAKIEADDKARVIREDVLLNGEKYLVGTWCTNKCDNDAISFEIESVKDHSFDVTKIKYASFDRGTGSIEGDVVKIKFISSHLFFSNYEDTTFFRLTSPTTMDMHNFFQGKMSKIPFEKKMKSSNPANN
jgi:tetratricopeptide (TPR) repeat protein